MKTIIKSNQSGKEFELLIEDEETYYPSFFIIVDNEKMEINANECCGKIILAAKYNFKNSFQLITPVEKTFLRKKIEDIKNISPLKYDIPNNATGYSDKKALKELNVDNDE